MGKSADEVRADIEDTRRDMSETIDAIADRTSPRRMVERRRQRMTQGWRSVRERVMGRAEYTYGTVGDQARRVPDAAGSAAGSARDAAGSVVDTARQVPDKLTEQAQGNPVAAGLVAFGAGLLAASLIPPTESEQRLAGTLRDQTQPLQDELRQAGQQVADDLKSTAKEGMEQVKSRASDAAGTVQEDVKSSAQEVRQQASS